MNNVIKRDGAKVPFDKEKIVTAIIKAMMDVGGVDEQLAEAIAEKVSNLKEPEMDVESIQDCVERQLMMSKRKDVAKAYILFRNHRNKMRSRKQAATFNDVVNVVSNNLTRENANMNADTPAGMMMKFAGETSREYSMQYLLTDEEFEAVRSNHMHIHDCDYYPTKSLTCIQHPLDKILANGFRAGHGASRPAKRIETAAILAAISLETVQNEQHGGQGIPAFDFYLAPYVRLTFKEELEKVSELMGRDYRKYGDMELEDYEYKDSSMPVQHAINETIKRTHQSMESFIHNMNTIHSRGGNQVVFSSINYGTDTSAEGRLIIRELLKCTYQGVGNGETPIFPIQIFKLKSGINANPEDPNYDLLELSTIVTAKRFFPNYINLDAPFNVDPDWTPGNYEKEVATMGCRTRVFEDRNGENTSVGRGNLSFTTINLVRLALESKDADEFFIRLENYTSLAVRQLLNRCKFQASAYKKQFPLLMSGLWKGSENLKPDDMIGEVLKHGTLSVGFIGLAECLTVLTGKHHGESEEAQELGLKIVGYMKEVCDAYADLYKMNISVIATPAEGLSGKFVKKDREEFGVIPNVTDREYYTNSNHIPVWYKCSFEHKLAVEAPYHPLTRAGHISYIEVDGNPEQNEDAVMDIINLMRKHDVGYGSINFARARCLDCGHEENAAKFDTCPACGSTNTDVLERITGYLVGSVNRWNGAKKAELNDRVSHMSGERVMK